MKVTAMNSVTLQQKHNILWVRYIPETFGGGKIFK